MKTEFRGEIGHRPRPQHARMPRAPCARRVQVFLHAAVGVVDAAVQRQFRRALLERVDGNLLEQRDGIVVQLAPLAGTQLAEEAGRVRIPAPPQILRER